MHPKESIKHYFYSRLVSISRYPLIRQIDLLVSLIFIKVAPDIPVSLKKSYSGPDGKRAGLVGFVVTFFFTFVINIIASYFNNTLYGIDPTILYFFDDYWNLALYGFVCPLYVGLTCWLVVLSIKGWVAINEFKNKSILRKTERKRFKIFKPIALGTLVLSVSFLLTTNYIYDIIHLKGQDQFYWFLSPKDHELKALGVYYFLLNFSLLTVTLIALTFFMSIYKLLMNVGKALESRKKIGSLDFQILKEELHVFTEGYIVTKGIIACYIVNIWIWAKSPLGSGTTENYIIALVLLTIIGFFLVSFPRYFVELQWYKLKSRSSKHGVINNNIPDLRNFEIKLIAQTLDYLFIGSFIIYALKQIIGLNF